MPYTKTIAGEAMSPITEAAVSPWQLVLDWLDAEEKRVATIGVYNAELTHQRLKGIFPVRIQDEYEAMNAANDAYWTATKALAAASAAIRAAAPLAPPDAAVEDAVLAGALTALQACVDQLQQDTAMLYAEYAQTAETTEAEKLARAVLARSAAPRTEGGR